jgi:HSP20 family protein
MACGNRERWPSIPGPEISTMSLKGGDDMRNGQDGKQGIMVMERPRRTSLWPDFERFMRGFPVPRRFARNWWAEWPEIDVFEREGKLVLRADVPGLKAEDFDVTVDRGLLTVSGKREEEKEIKEENYYCSERSFGEFSRTIRLPEGVTAESVGASYTDGVLEVTVPRPVETEAKATKVPVK